MKAGLFVPGYSLNLTLKPTDFLAQYEARLKAPLHPVDAALPAWGAVDRRLWAQFHVAKAVGQQSKIYAVRSGPERLKYALPDTKKAMEDQQARWIQGASFLLPLSENQPAEDHRRLYARPFLIEKLDAGALALHEVIAGNEITSGYVWQLAVEFYLMQRAGQNVQQAFLWTEIARNQFQKNDVTDQVMQKLPAAQDHVAQLSAALMAMPVLALPGTHEQITDYPVSALLDSDVRGGPDYYAKFNLLDRLVALGILDMRLVPDPEKLARAFPKHMTPLHQAQIRAHQNIQGFFNLEGLRGELGALSWPVYSIDFETMIKTPEGEDQVPYQFASRGVNPDGEALFHDQFLPTSSDDPRVDFSRALVTSLNREGGKGSILVYNAPFEESRIRETAAYLENHGHADLAKQLLQVLPRFVDLLVVLRKYVYLPEFHGSYSLKDTFPALMGTAMEESYKDLPIKDGLQAASEIVRLMELIKKREESSDASESIRLVAEIDELRQNLFDYCGLDVKAPIQMLFKLLEKIKA